MNNQDLGKNLLATIKERKLVPKPKWHFLLKDYVIWFLAILSFIIGSLAFAVVLYMIVNNDWDVYKNINDSLWEFVFVSLPYFWITLLGIFVFAADYNLRHTKKGYKYSLHNIILLTVIGSIILGTLFFNFGLGRIIDNVFADRLPFYHQFTGMRHMRWVQPEIGLLAGMVVSVMDKNNFQIMCRNNMIWEINAEEAIFIEGATPQVGRLIRIIGEKVGGNTFKAKRVLPGHPGPGFKIPRFFPEPLNFLPPPFERNFFPRRSM